MLSQERGKSMVQLAKVWQEKESNDTNLEMSKKSFICRSRAKKLVMLELIRSTTTRIVCYVLHGLSESASSNQERD